MGIQSLLTILLTLSSTQAALLNEQVLITVKNVFNEINRIPPQILRHFNRSSWLNTNELRTADNPDPEYDFIIVGSGSAGSVIANRLSENPEWKILLIEAGLQEGPIMQIPMMAANFQGTDYDWNYFMQYENTSALGFINSQMPWPRGKALGGTSTINYMIYTRGNKYDYDRWEAAGNPGWGYDDVLPYYMKSERARLQVADYEYHNTKGYLSVEDPYATPLLKYFIKGSNELGLPYLDYNAPGPILGVSQVQATTRNGKRNSVATAFLWPIKHRKNLDILTNAFVTKILINPVSNEAYGVDYEIRGQKFTVKARKEVIISAGTFNSAQLLMLSGIGPHDHLQEMDIPIIQDLPVGENLHDHLCFLGPGFLIDQNLSLDPYKLFSPTSILSYLINGTGPLSSIGGVDGLGYIKTEVAQYAENYPDIELIFNSGSLKSDYGSILRRGFRIRDDIYYPQFKSVERIPDWGILPMLLHPKSIGYMKLQSKNPYDQPLLHGNYYTDPENEDIRTMIAAIRFMQRLAKTKAFQSIGTRMNPARTPGCTHYEYDSDDYWECSLRTMSVTLHHQVGTIKMGPPDDPGAVVNHELKVYGVAKLRVADCSIIPFALSAHTNAPSIMVGEKAADMIKMDWTTNTL